MKKMFLILFVMMLVILPAFIGCEGPEGPAGPAGSTGNDGQDGEDGQDGQDGEDGADGALFCLTCHEPSIMNQKEAEFAEAGHFDAYTRTTSTSCAPCHSHEGFIEYGLTGQTPLGAGFEHGSSMTCGTCHSHKNNGSGAVFDADEIPIRFNDPVVMLTGIDNMDFGNNSNLCVRCHQPRRAWTTYYDETGDSVMVTSSHAGPHHGAQVTALMGLGGDHRLNSESDASVLGPSAHGTDSDCIKCHLVDNVHTFKPASAACVACHEVSDDFDHNDKRVLIAEKMATLAEYLLAVEGQGIERDTAGVWQVIPDSLVHGILHEEEGELHPNLGQFERDHYSAFWNYMTVLEDQSGGVHNPPYIEALLDNAIAVFE